MSTSRTAAFTMGTVTISGPSPTRTRVPPERVACRVNTQMGYILQNTVAGACVGSVKNEGIFVSVVDCLGYSREAPGRGRMLSGVCKSETRGNQSEKGNLFLKDFGRNPKFLF